MVDALDSKSSEVNPHGGSSPPHGTKLNLFESHKIRDSERLHFFRRLSGTESGTDFRLFILCSVVIDTGDQVPVS